MPIMTCDNVMSAGVQVHETYVIFINSRSYVNLVITDFIYYGHSLVGRWSTDAASAAIDRV